MRIQYFVKLIFIISLIASLSAPANAGVSQDMEGFWDSLGGTSNVTDPRFVKGQRAGHLSLGSIQMRSNIQNSQLASMRLPSLRAGCGGIDFYAGGFSFISSDELISLMKSIGSNAPGALAQLALDNISPKIGAIVKYFQNLAREINSLNINSCAAANALIKNPGGVLNSAKTQGCRLSGLVSNKYQDAAAANSACTSGGGATKTTNDASESVKEQFKLTDINIAWKALKDAGLIDMASTDSIELAEMFMALSGTIIITGGGDDNSETAINNYSPEIMQGKTISALLSGGSIRTMKCDDPEKCLAVSQEDITLEAEKSYFGKVSAIIEEIAVSISDDSDSSLSVNAQKLLSFSSLPIYQIINVHAAYYRDTVELGSIAEFLAMDILYGYLGKINKEVSKAAERYNKEPHNQVFKSFFENQKEINQELRSKKKSLGDQFMNYMNVIERTSAVEDSLKKDTNSRIRFGKH